MAQINMPVSFEKKKIFMEWKSIWETLADNTSDMSLCEGVMLIDADTPVCVCMYNVWAYTCAHTHKHTHNFVGIMTSYSYYIKKVRLNSQLRTNANLQLCHFFIIIKLCCVKLSVPLHPTLRYQRKSSLLFS